MKTFAGFILLLSILAGACNSGDPLPSDIISTQPAPAGKLFIIGGGERTPLLMERMLDESRIDNNSYIAVLPMSSEEPDSAYYYIARDIQAVNPVKCINLHFTESDLINETKLDSLRKAQIVFITGGDQNRFMKLVKGTPIQDAIQAAFDSGALIAGTSAGAALMSEIMISGDENFSAEYEPTYDKLWKENGIYQDGLGLLDHVIIDQHFVARSRHNRLLSALCDYPGRFGMGIDEKTAAIIKNNQLSVAGENQVLLFYPQDTCQIQMHRIGMKNVRLDILLPGDTVNLNL